jgi:hypothetical protein
MSVMKSLIHFASKTMTSFFDSVPKSNDIPFYDVIVVGLGGHGSAALAHLAKAAPDKNILGIERFDIAHANGTFYPQQ